MLCRYFFAAVDRINDANRISNSYFTLLRRYSSNAFSLRTHNCGELRKGDIGKKVELYGWVLKNRFNGSFIVLHDKYGFVQARLPQNSQFKNIAATIRTEDVLKVIGIVTSRGDDSNPEMETGDIDVEIESLEILNKCSSIPFPIIGNLKAEAETDIELRKRLTFRYFDLRKSEAQRLLHLRANVVKKIRRCLEDELGFVEVETPTLAAHTPGGAAEFIVPTQMHGQVYSLPQSPQIYKQLLMIGQLDRYYQIARCYRDEAIRGDRQPEFTQVDLELSFVSQNQILSLLEKMIVDSWPESLASQCPTVPFQRLTFDDAMTKYGTDKPDLRIPWIFEECSNIFKNSPSTKAYGFVVKDYRMNEKLPSLGALKRKFIKLFPHCDHKNLRFINVLNEKEVFSKEIDKNLIQKFDLGVDDLLVIGVTNEPGRSKCYSLLSTLGFARNYIADLFNLRSQKTFSIAWIIDFPLFVESAEDSSKLESAHHPFTAPIPEHLERLKNGESLDTIKAQHYDLVINGAEMGGGSIRIHDAALQRHVFENILQFPTKTLEPFLTALSLGAPPHGGFALGLDRYVACLGSEGNPHASVREVIAFPKTKEGRCAMFSTPFEPDKEMLQRYHCSFDDSDQKKYRF